ncbi:uncharacterized protein LOC128201118 [Galleria mellonella]|uniref:Uncharacterized protein LOC128201118 n=1 Tax=Galleria mellonella TaxID=7137 RepID=A0ABM3MNY2_GALME|nr:uncharacterized protein LOC128201118 [Galleria mellonella]
MSQFPPPPPGAQPPPYYPPPVYPPPQHPPHYPHPPHLVYPQPPEIHISYPYYVPGTAMMPAQNPVEPSQPSQPTYITNYIYHGDSSNTPALPDPVQVVETSGDFDWIPSTATTANMLTGRAVVGGHEGWDGSPLWVIRAWHNGDLIPGKLSVRHNAASIMYDGKEVPVQNIEVLCSKPDNLRWVPGSNGSVPPGAIAGGRTASGETLYVGRARYQLSVTPGKVHPSHYSCYIGFAGAEVAVKMYDVLCRIS